MLALLATCTQTALAYSYDWWFNEIHGDLYLTIARSPLRNADGTDYCGNVTSNNNQPRTTGTLVHNGTDLGNGYQPYRYVYSIFDGGVIHAIVNSGQNTYVTVSYDNNTFRVKYQHITPVAGLKVGDTVGSASVIGSLCYYTDGNHLHFAALNNFDKVLKLFPYYRHKSEWAGGTSLDLFSKDLFYENQLFISAKYLDEGIIYPLTSLEVYYRINYGAWQGPKLMSTINRACRVNGPLI